jgi:phosphoglucomutase
MLQSHNWNRLDNICSDHKVSVRPSGTEPKIKFYMEIKGEMHCPKCYAGANADAMEKVEAIKKSLGI